MSAAPVEPKTAERGELRALTAMRGVAALAVVATHFSATGQNLTAQTIPSLVPHGYMAVDFFFVLSGFIMSYTYLASFQARRPGAYTDFLARRVARVMPLHVSVVLIVAVLGAVDIALTGANRFFVSGSFAADLAANLLLLPGLGIGATFNGPAWSISTEIVAYLAFPLLVAIFFAGRAVSALGGIVAVGLLVLLATRLPRLGLTYEAMPLNLVRCLAEFSLGMLAFRAYDAPRLRAIFAADIVAFGLAAACGLSLVLRVDLPAALMFPFLVVAFAANQGRAAALLSTRVPYFLGVVSYSIYLIHNPIRPLELGLATAMLGTDVHPAVALGFAALGTLVVIPFAWVAYVLVEQPGRRVVRQMFASAQTPFIRKHP